MISCLGFIFSCLVLPCLTNLQEYKQHLGEEQNHAVVKQVWQGQRRETWGNAGNSSTSVQVWTLKRTEVRMKVKKVLNCSRTRANKAGAQIKYCKAKKGGYKKYHKRPKELSGWPLRTGRGSSRQGRCQRTLCIKRTLESVAKITDRLSEPIAERCSPTKKNTENGGHSTSGSSSADLCQVKYQT